MAEQYCESRAPGPGTPGDSETAVKEAAERALRDHDSAATALRFSDALAAIFSLVDAANKHYQRTQPWQLAKSADQRAALEAALYAGLEAVRLAGYLLFPYMPQVADRITEQLGVSAASASRWSDVARWGVLEKGTPVHVGAPLFPRLERTTAA
jgi:methionyl-tRNA synthetase